MVWLLPQKRFQRQWISVLGPIRVLRWQGAPARGSVGPKGTSDCRTPVRKGISRATVFLGRIGVATARSSRSIGISSPPSVLSAMDDFGSSMICLSEVWVVVFKPLQRAEGCDHVSVFSDCILVPGSRTCTKNILSAPDMISNSQVQIDMPYEYCISQVQGYIARD